MSSQEINIRVSLVSHLLVLGYYLINISRMVLDGGLEAKRVFTLWAVVIVAIIVITILGNILSYILLHIAQAVRTGKAEEMRFVNDERDRLIELKGTRVAYIVFSLGVFLSMLTFVFAQPPLVMFSLIIFFGLVAELSGDIAQLIYYRKGVVYA
jgi:hypothetical protein